METLLESKLWKFAMTWGALSAVLGGLILAWPGTSILVASTLFGIYLLVSGFAGVAMAFTLPESAGMRVMLFISGVLSVIQKFVDEITGLYCFRGCGCRTKPPHDSFRRVRSQLGEYQMQPQTTPQ